MMIITSLITEYNPFHNGHIHHIEASRRLTGADVVIAIMSGNFTQRGEIAVTDKFTRAEAAIRHVDLVVELPLLNAISFADDFAMGGVHIAELLGSDHIVFGSESGDINALKEVHSKLKDSDIKSRMETYMKKGYSYPARSTPPSVPTSSVERTIHSAWHTSGRSRNSGRTSYP